MERHPALFRRRYPGYKQSSSPLEPLDDLRDWIAGLRSESYTSDILAKVHGLADAREAAKEVRHYADAAIGFIDQAYSGPEDTSYLPLYYAALNLSKIYIVASGRRSAIPANRWHGASYNPTRATPSDLLKDSIFLSEKGILGLFYECLTGEKFAGELKRRRSPRLRLSAIYPYIPGISIELGAAYNIKTALYVMSLGLNGKPSEYFFEARLYDAPPWHRLPFVDARGLGLKLVSDKGSNPRVFHTKRQVFPSETAAGEYYASFLKPCLIYESVNDDPKAFVQYGDPGPVVPVITSGSLRLLPEELPLWLALFHLSNVVRYRPELLARFRDSRAWTTILSLRRHGMYRFMVLFWSFLHREKTVILNA